MRAQFIVPTAANHSTAANPPPESICTAKIRAERIVPIGIEMKIPVRRSAN
ncbi:hypothetical protein [Mesorhizobium loti]|uniref:hypothetical protein n=1 Tax=Rhizobium loti TaxID=381 RepID=UPI0004187D4C|nr:hypothetical protein [Mesorhizobium loti]